MHACKPHPYPKTNPTPSASGPYISLIPRNHHGRKLLDFFPLVRSASILLGPPEEDVHINFHTDVSSSFLLMDACRTHWILDRRQLDEAMSEDLEFVDIATLTKIKMWYYNCTLVSIPSHSTRHDTSQGHKTQSVTDHFFFFFLLEPK